MKVLKASELRKISDEELSEKLLELKQELSKLEISAGRGTLKKESGNLKSVRRNIARILTVMSEKKRTAEVAAE